MRLQHQGRCRHHLQQTIGFPAQHGKLSYLYLERIWSRDRLVTGRSRNPEHSRRCRKRAPDHLLDETGLFINGQVEHHPDKPLFLTTDELPVLPPGRLFHLRPDARARDTDLILTLQLVQIFHFLALQKLVDTFEMFRHFLVSEFINFGHKTVQEVSVMRCYSQRLEGDDLQRWRILYF